MKILEHLFWRTSANSCFWFFKTATEQWWVAASVLTLLLSSDNLLTGYEQLSNQQFNRNWSTCVGKIDYCQIKNSIKIRQINFLSKKLIHVKEKICLRFKLFKNFQGTA